MSTAFEPCGVYVVTRWMEGVEAEVVWCARTDGPCSYPGADHAQRSNDRRCGASPGRLLHVSWAPDAIDDALTTLLAYRDGGHGFVTPASQTVAVAIDALRACGGKEAS